MYKVSVLRGTKVRPQLEEVTTIVADRFEITDHSQSIGYGIGIVFYNDESRFLRKNTEKIVAFLSGTDWVIETV